MNYRSFTTLLPCLLALSSRERFLLSTLLSLYRFILSSTFRIPWATHVHQYQEAGWLGKLVCCGL